MFLFFDDSADPLPQTMKRRAAEIADHANSPRGGFGEGSDFLRGLDEIERQCEFLFSLLSLSPFVFSKMDSLNFLNEAHKMYPVFRASHDNSKAVRDWFADVKKPQ